MSTTAMTLMGPVDKRGRAEPTARERLRERSDEARPLENAEHVPPLRQHRRAGPQQQRR